jgi:hypothetical protein
MGSWRVGEKRDREEKSGRRVEASRLGVRRVTVEDTKVGELEEDQEVVGRLKESGKR